MLKINWKISSCYLYWQKKDWSFFTIFNRHYNSFIDYTNKRINYM